MSDATISRRFVRVLPGVHGDGDPEFVDVIVVATHSYAALAARPRGVGAVGVPVGPQGHDSGSHGGGLRRGPERRRRRQARRRVHRRRPDRERGQGGAAARRPPQRTGASADRHGRAQRRLGTRTAVDPRPRRPRIPTGGQRSGGAVRGGSPGPASTADRGSRRARIPQCAGRVPPCSPYTSAKSRPPDTGVGTRRRCGEPRAAARSDPSCSARSSPSSQTSRAALTVFSAAEWARS